MTSLSAVATGLGPQVFECPKLCKCHGAEFGEGGNHRQRAGANRVVVSLMGGICTTLGTSRANWVCSHVGGTCSRLQSRAMRTVGIGERLRLSRNHRRRGCLFKS